MPNTDALHVHDDEDDIDCCLCGIELLDADLTSDSELPAAIGGVEAIAEQREDAEDLDGCELDFSEADLTTDAELPLATGGVA
jgi:hypothetical protein